MPLALRIVEGLAPLGLSLALIWVRPAGRSLVTWGRVALLHLTGPRHAHRDRPSAEQLGSGQCAARPPHLFTVTERSAATTAMPLPPRRAQRPARPATQDQPFVPWAIDGDVITFRDGRSCAVLECGGVSTALMGEVALRATHAAYHAFLVGLPWLLQLLVWASPVVLRAHVAAREARLAGLSPALQELESADAAFMEREARRLGLLDHRLFVVIPAPDRADRTIPTASLLPALQKWFQPQPLESDNAVAAVLDERCERVAAALTAVGVHTRRLSTDGLRALWYRLLAPRSAAVQPFDAGHTALIARPEITFIHQRRPDVEGQDA